MATTGAPEAGCQALPLARVLVTCLAAAEPDAGVGVQELTHITQTIITMTTTTVSGAGVAAGGPGIVLPLTMKAPRAKQAGSEALQGDRLCLDRTF